VTNGGIGRSISLGSGAARKFLVEVVGLVEIPMNQFLFSPLEFARGREVIRKSIIGMRRIRHEIEQLTKRLPRAAIAKFR
jgi:hypothetical protein